MKIFNEDGTFSGSFINASITFVYLILIIIGMFYNPVADQIIKLKDFMMWFFAISFGLWSTKKTIEYIMDGKTIKIEE